MIIAVVGALLVGLSLGIFGSGGSILTVPVLVYLLGHGEKIAIAESLGIVGTIALVGSLSYARDGLVQWRLVLFFGVPSMASTFAGAWIASGVPGELQLGVFGVVMLLAAWRMWRRGQQAPQTEQGRSDERRLVIGAQGIAVGLLTGIVGIGGGFLIVPALVLIGGLSMQRAVATSLVIIAMNACVGLLKHSAVLSAMDERAHWAIMAVFVAFGILGSFVGRAIQSRLNQALLQRGFALFLALIACVMLLRELLQLVL